MAITTPHRVFRGARETLPSYPAGRRSGRWLVVFFGVASLCVSGAACTKARAQTVPDGPPLAMPQPPSRVFAPLEEEPLVSSPIATETPATPAPAVPAARPPARRAATTPAEPEKAESTPPAPVPAADTPRELRAASSPADAEAERRILLLLQRAANDLRNVDYGKLTRGGKDNYDQAKGFSEEAEKALKERNFVYAQTAADKAAKLAAELLGR